MLTGNYSLKTTEHGALLAQLGSALPFFFVTYAGNFPKPLRNMNTGRGAI